MDWRWLTGAGMVGAALLGRRPGAVPAAEGRRLVPGLGAPELDIVRDRRGVPHIRAASLRDAAFGLGYVHAQDRLWQLELRRRAGLGRLAELLGERALPADRFVRRVGIPRAARREWRRLTETEGGSLGERLLRGYSLGVNAYILEVQQGRQPQCLELRLLRWSPTPWRPQHSLAWFKLLAYGLSCGWQAALLRWLLLVELGPLRASEVDPAAGLTAALMDGTPLGPARTMAVWREAAELIRMDGGSNAWAVTPVRAAGGKAQLAADPHLPLEWPAFWYLARLEAPLSAAERELWSRLMADQSGLDAGKADGGGEGQRDRFDGVSQHYGAVVPPSGLDAAGASAPGLPGILCGRNQALAWGPTVAMASDQDLFIERLEGWPEPSYATDDGSVPAEVRREEIPVRGQDPVESVAVVTRNGPILARLRRSGGAMMWDDDRPPLPGAWRGLAMRWVGTDHEAAPAVDAVGLMTCLNLVRERDELQQICRAWRDPCQRVAYAFRDGQAGLVMAGCVPRRRRGDGALPLPGWLEANRWAGTESLGDAGEPGRHQTARGISVAANDAIPGVPGVYAPGFRARRIRQVLLNVPELTVTHHRRLQLDRETGLGQRFVARLRERPPAVEGPAERRALGELLTWDGRLEPGSAGAAVFQCVFNEFLHLLTEQRLGPRLGSHYLGRGFSPLSRSTAWGARAPVAILTLWLPDGRRWQWQELLERAFKQGVRRLVGALGERPEDWQWGRLRTVQPSHVLAGEHPWLQRLFAVPEVTLAGGIDTVAPGGFSYTGFPDGAGSVGIYRQVVDWSQPDRFWVALAGGQSGHPASPHHRDLLPAWQQGDLYPVWMGEEAPPEEFGPHQRLVLARTENAEDRGR